MKRWLSLLVFLIALSVLSGYMMSKASWVGKFGISFFYKQYTFLKIWWQGAIIVFSGLLLIFIIKALVRKALNNTSAIIVYIISLLLALAGLYFTYYDFRHDISHRLLGERFHIGAYLFWLGWISICLFYLLAKKPQKIPIAANKNNTGME